MRRLNPAMTLTTALLTAAAAASPNPSRAQVEGPAAVRPSPMAPEAPAAISPGDSMAAARAPRHLLRNGQDYLKYGEYLRALALFREAESRIGELAPAEQQELRGAIEAARQGMRAPEAPEDAVAVRNASARPRAGAMPGAIALAEPPATTPGPMASPDGVVLTGGEGPGYAAPIPPVPPEPIAIDPSVLPSTAAAAPLPMPMDLPPVDAAAPALPADPAPPMAAESPVPVETAATEPAPVALTAEPPAPASTTPEPAALPTVEPTPTATPGTAPAATPEPAAGPSPITLPPLPADSGGASGSWPTAALGAMTTEGPRGDDPSPSPPAELPALPPPAEELMELGRLGDRPPAPAEALPSASPSPAAGSSMVAEDPAMPRRSNEYRDLLSPEQREEIMMIVRRQEEAEERGLMPAPLQDDPGMLGYDRDELSGSAIQLPRPPSPTEIRPIQSIPVAEDFVPLPARRFNASRKYWAAAATCHAPLYFQDPVLERYGQSVEQKLGPVGRFLSYPLDDPSQSRQRNQIAQPLFSAALFAAEIVTWPYKAVVDPPGEAEYDLGYYRPGDLVPPDVFYAPVHGVGPPLRGKHY